MSILFSGLFSETNKDKGLLLFRLLMGGAMIIHGISKFLGGSDVLIWVGSMLQMFGITEGFLLFGILAAATELTAGILVFLGLFTRLGSLMLLGTLSVATITSIPNGFVAAFGYSYPLEMFFAFLMLLITGPGKYSLDYNIAGNKYHE